ncbi:hypothetical protein IAS59_003870 [Cryptococcus gattii]
MEKGCGPSSTVATVSTAGDSLSPCLAESLRDGSTARTLSNIVCPPVDTKPLTPTNPRLNWDSLITVSQSLR